MNKNQQVEEQIKREIVRTNAKLRHFRGIAASVVQDARGVWRQIWDACQDQRSCDEILEGVNEPIGQVPAEGWQDLREKLHLLGHYLDYAQRLCDGSIETISKDKKGE